MVSRVPNFAGERTYVWDDLARTILAIDIDEPESDTYLCYRNTQGCAPGGDGTGLRHLREAGESRKIMSVQMPPAGMYFVMRRQRRESHGIVRRIASLTVARQYKAAKGRKIYDVVVSAPEGGDGPLHPHTPRTTGVERSERRTAGNVACADSNHAINPGNTKANICSRSRFRGLMHAKFGVAAAETAESAFDVLAGDATNAEIARKPRLGGAIVRSVAFR